MSAFNHVRNVRELAEATARMLAVQVASDDVGLYTLDETETHLWSADNVESRHIDEPGLLTWSVLQRETVAASGSDERASEAEKRYGSILTVPIVAGGQVLGGLQLSRQASTGFTPDEVAKVQGIALQVSGGIVLAKAREDTSNFMVHAEEWLIEAIEEHAPGGDGHIWRVSQVAVGIAAVLAFSETDRRRIWMAARYHDLGWLLARGRKSWEVERYHPIWGADALRQVRLLQPIASLVEMSHERFDGSGHPMGLSGECIPLEAYVLALAEDFDETMTAQGFTQGESLGLEGQTERLALAIEQFVDASEGVHHPRVLEAFGHFAGTGLLQALAT